MAALSIRDLDDGVRDRLRVRAAEHGRSMEAEVRAILTDAADGPSAPVGLVDSLLDAFGPLGGVDLDLPARSDAPRSPDFG